MTTIVIPNTTSSTLSKDVQLTAAALEETDRAVADLLAQDQDQGQGEAPVDGQGEVGQGEVGQGEGLVGLVQSTRTCTSQHPLADSPLHPLSSPVGIQQENINHESPDDEKALQPPPSKVYPNHPIVNLSSLILELQTYL